MTNNHFTILITSYNCGKWVKKNLNSALNQDYDNYEVIYVDDNSQDNTWEIVSSYKDDKLRSFKNSFNKGKMENMYYHINQSKDNTIIVILDGDDWLANNKVLETLNKAYNNNNIWITNGSYIIDPIGQTVKPIITESYWRDNIRKKSWQFSHLGTFKKELFTKIKKKHLMNKRGEFWATTSDQAIMWPMVEMAGPEHHSVIDEVLYIYNRHNPLSDDRVNRKDQLDTESTIRSFPPYKRIESL